MSDRTLANLLSHWPFVETRIHWRQRRAHREVLALLAQLQLDAGGSAIHFGGARLLELAGVDDRGEPLMTVGEATAMSDALALLAARGVVHRWPGRGRRPHAWTLNPELGRWRAVEWVVSAHAVQEAMGSCICHGPRAVVAEFPDQRGYRRRTSRRFRIPRELHALPSGLLPVELRDKREGSVAIAHSQAREACGTPWQRSGIGGLSPISGGSNEPLLLSQGAEERVSILQGGLRAACGSEAWPSAKQLYARLVDVAGRFNLDQALAGAAELQRLNDARRASGREPLLVPLLLEQLELWARGPVCASLGEQVA